MRQRTGTKATALLLLLLGAGWGCSSDSTAPEGDPPPESDPDAVAIDVADSFFSPQTATVSGGETVTWMWSGTLSHNVTWDTADLSDSATQTSGSHEVTMPSEPGEYGYHCTVHGSPGTGMHGTIVVE